MQQNDRSLFDFLPFCDPGVTTYRNESKVMNGLYGIGIGNQPWKAKEHRWGDPSLYQHLFQPQGILSQVISVTESEIMRQSELGVVGVCIGVVAPGDGQFALLLPADELLPCLGMSLYPSACDEEGDRYRRGEMSVQCCIESVLEALFGGGTEIRCQCYAFVAVGDTVVLEWHRCVDTLCKKPAVAGGMASSFAAGESRFYGALKGMGIDRKAVAAVSTAKSTQNHLFAAIGSGGTEVYCLVVCDRSPLKRECKE